MIKIAFTELPHLSKSYDKGLHRNISYVPRKLFVGVPSKFATRMIFKQPAESQLVISSSGPLYLHPISKETAPLNFRNDKVNDIVERSGLVVWGKLNLSTSTRQSS